MLFIHELGASRDIENDGSIMLQGVKFNLDVSVNEEAFCLKMPHSMERLVGFLKEVEQLNQTKDLIRGGLVLYADDQFINQK